MTTAQPLSGTWIVLATLVVVLMSMPLTAAAGSNAASEACCSEETCHTETETADENFPSANDCCPDSCSNCFLPCCGCVVALMKVPAMESQATESKGMVASPLKPFDSGYRFKIYHPPGC